MAEDSLNPKNRGLGRGLNALFESEEGVYPQVDAEGQTPGTQRKMVGIEQLIANPAQPRQVFEENALEELAASVKEYGLLQPILVRPAEGQDDIYQIVAGERRWRASQRAQLHEVPIVIRELDDSEVLQIGLVENLQRRDLNPLEEAEGYKALIDQFEHTQNKVAELVGKSRSHVANMVRLLSLPKGVVDLVNAGDLSMGHARALLSADEPEKLAKQAAKDGLSVRQLEQLVYKKEEKPSTGSKEKSSAKTLFKNPDTLALERELSDSLGLDVKINVKEGDHKGYVQIGFKSLDQLDFLLKQLAPERLT